MLTKSSTRKYVRGTYVLFEEKFECLDMLFLNLETIFFFA